MIYTKFFAVLEFWKHEAGWICSTAGALFSSSCTEPITASLRMPLKVAERSGSTVQMGRILPHGVDSIHIWFWNKLADIWGFLQKGSWSWGHRSSEDLGFWPSLIVPTTLLIDMELENNQLGSAAWFGWFINGIRCWYIEICLYYLWVKNNKKMIPIFRPVTMCSKNLQKSFRHPWIENGLVGKLATLRHLARKKTQKLVSYKKTGLISNRRSRITRWTTRGRWTWWWI